MTHFHKGSRKKILIAGPLRGGGGKWPVIKEKKTPFKT